MRHERQIEMSGDNRRPIDRIAFRAANDMNNPRNPVLPQHGAHPCDSMARIRATPRGLSRQSGTGAAGSINTSGWVIKKTVAERTDAMRGGPDVTPVPRPRQAYARGS